MENNHAAFGIYRSRDEIRKAADSLSAAGFNPNKIMVMLPENYGAQDFAYDLRMMVRLGAVIGALVGTVAGALIGLFVFTGVSYTLLGALFGLFFGAASGALVGIGTPEKPGQRYLQYLRDGGYLLSVHVENGDESRKAIEVLESTGAQDIADTDEVNAWMTVLDRKKKAGPLSLVTGTP